MHTHYCPVIYCYIRSHLKLSKLRQPPCHHLHKHHCVSGIWREQECFVSAHDLQGASKHWWLQQLGLQCPRRLLHLLLWHSGSNSGQDGLCMGAFPAWALVAPPEAAPRQPGRCRQPFLTEPRSPAALPPPFLLITCKSQGQTMLMKGGSRPPVFSWEIAARSACTEVGEMEDITGHLSFANLPAITNKPPLENVSWSSRYTFQTVVLLSSKNADRAI